MNIGCEFEKDPLKTKGTQKKNEASPRVTTKNLCSVECTQKLLCGVLTVKNKAGPTVATNVTNG